MIFVSEIFGSTIQGEGAEAGARCIFCRVSNCDYSCQWCDSKFTWADKNALRLFGEEVSEKLLDKCISTNTYHVVLTGGNPCLYDFEEVIDTLHDHSIKVDVETQGSILPKWLNKIDTITFSPKPPSSKQKDTYENIKMFLENNVFLNENYLEDIKKQNITIKIPVFNDEDIDYCRKFAALVEKLNEKECNYINLKFYFSVGNSDTATKESIRDRVLMSYEDLINIINELNYPEFKHCYILPQLHTLIWGNKQGV